MDFLSCNVAVESKGQQRLAVVANLP